MKRSILCVISAIFLVTGCESIAPPSHAQDPLLTVPADPHQATPPHWVEFARLPPADASAKTEVDLNSVAKTDGDLIEIWERGVFDKNSEASIKFGFQVTEAHYLIDCKSGHFGWLGFNDRKWNGDLIRARTVPNYDHHDPRYISGGLSINAVAQLACDQAKKNWPGDPNYNFHVQQIKATVPLSDQQKMAITQALNDRKEIDKKNVPFAKPFLIAQSRKNVCQSMIGADGTPSSFELCDAQGVFSHDVYTVNIGGIPILRGIDDSATTGIKGRFYGSSVELQCEPVNQLAAGATQKEIEDGVQSEQTDMPNATFEQRLAHVISSNVLEMGRHCILSNTDGAVAKLDVVSP